ncbi:MAG: glycosyltransferase family 4 protein [Proteobacteria bacterium]|nr:glycosyltransferase family 4 protein [Pseudomonadota bacterium]
MTLWLTGRRTAGERRGGDAMQVAESAEAARAAGIDVRIEHDAAAVTPAAGDVVHLFCLQRVHDWGDLPERARAAGARLLLTPLWHPLELYHRAGRRGVDALAARVVRDADTMAGLRWGRAGIAERAAEVRALADLTLLADPAESALLPGVPGPEITIPVAIADLGSDPAQCPFPPPPGDFIACVGRIEPLKNPEAVALAALDLRLPVRFLGSATGLRHARYGRGLDAIELDYPTLRAWLNRARVHVLASWTEVVGRATLEAALGGAAVVMTDVGHAPAMLGRDTDGVFVVPPGDGDALRAAMRAAWDRGRVPDSELVSRVRDRFTWNAAGPALVEVWTA